uniref:Hexosyltransferase n=1 Tax=Heliothis virescens TaxID=7102 RepID=A0A2A4K9J6_HELVI
MSHFSHRDAVRQTYGKANVPGRTVKSLFFLGTDGKQKSELQKQIDKEMAEFRDIIQIDFIDNYYNNTRKTMMSFRWVYEHCPTADYYLFTDDDMYISANNLLGYLHDREATRKPDTSAANDKPSTASAESDDCLYAGYVFDSIPQRFRSSKWRVSLEEYPWDRWPAYVTAGAYVVSNKAMKVMYVASLFIKHFRFDDVYLGIVAKKAGIIPTHCPEFHFYKKEFSVEGYKDVIASHGYGDRDELIRVWCEMNSGFLTNSGICSTTDKLDLFIVVKSAMSHFSHRDAVRQTYGKANVPGRTVKSLFFLGTDGKQKSELQKQIDKEMAEFRDIIQIDFIDNYYNNTRKTMMSFRWVYEHCPTADYYLFTDDDMYISANNLLGYLHDREATRKPDTSAANDKPSTASAESDDCLYAGYVFDSIPQRFRSSKWRVSLEEYPWDRWPAYVTAGAYVVSNKAMKA